MMRSKFKLISRIAIFCLCLGAVYDLYYAHSNPNPQKLIYAVKKIASFEIPENERDLQTTCVNFTPPHNSIFFVETSCKGGLNSRQACAVESAARVHPNRQTIVLFTAPLSVKFKKSATYLKLISEMKVEFININVNDFANNTPLAELIKKDPTKNSKYRTEHNSDIMRILTLYKYGGLYLDLDVIVMKSFDSLPNNFVARQSDKEVAAGIMALSIDRIGKNFSEIAVRDLASSYNPNVWGHNGPGLVARTLYKICSVKDVLKMTESTCNGIHVLHQKLFYPIFYPAWRKYFEDRQPEATDAYTHHVWNALGHKSHVPKNSLYARLAQKYCPDIYSIYGDKFGS